jgi:hypothetical protein
VSHDCFAYFDVIGNFIFSPPHRYRLKNIETNQNIILKKSLILFSSHPVNNVVSIAPTVQKTIQAIDNSKIIFKICLSQPTKK